MPLFLMGCFPVDFQEVKQPLRTKSGLRKGNGPLRPWWHGAGWHFSRLLTGLFSAGEIQKGTAKRGRQKICHKLS